MKTRVLTQSDIQRVVDMHTVVPAIETAFAAHGRGETQMPVKVYLDLPEFNGDFRAMPAYLEGSAGVKWVNAHPSNPERFGLPSVLGMYILSDPETAQPLAVMDATLLTALRTGAAGAVATKHLARSDASCVGFIGCGVQARTLHAALSVVMGDFEVVASDASSEAAEEFASEVGGRAAGLDEAAACDVVCTATPVRDPIIRRDWVRSGAHINAMGADAHGKQELDTQVLLDAVVVLDDWAQASSSGEVNVPLETGALSRDAIRGGLGEIVAGELAGRAAPDEITVFDSTGLAVQDVALARLIYEAARDADVGLEVDFRG
ncbi:MAG: ornithine cyclodeaminase family protein [Acidobacteria bacterium]|nr:ornithine cyclodeaminase family protein [Acidobacteriota bacterium]